MDSESFLQRETILRYFWCDTHRSNDFMDIEGPLFCLSLISCVLLSSNSWRSDTGSESLCNARCSVQLMQYLNSHSAYNVPSAMHFLATLYVFSNLQPVDAFTKCITNIFWFCWNCNIMHYSSVCNISDSFHHL